MVNTGKDTIYKKGAFQVFAFIMDISIRVSNNKEHDIEKKDVSQGVKNYSFIEKKIIIERY